VVEIGVEKSVEKGLGGRGSGCVSAARVRQDVRSSRTEALSLCLYPLES
jgi:hypothetical protein